LVNSKDSNGRMGDLFHAAQPAHAHIIFRCH
jgi:hypothetical protein